MEIAIIENGVVIQVGEYKSIFPNTSFPSSGPSDEFLLENNSKKLNRFKAHDRATQKLVSVEPYLDGEFVSVVEVQELTGEEIQQQNSNFIETNTS